MTINQQLAAFEMARQAGAESSILSMEMAQEEFDSIPTRWQIPWEEIDQEVSDRPGTGSYVTNPGPYILFSKELTEKYLKPAKEMWNLMQSAHDCWAMDNDPRALVLSWVEGIDPETPNISWWAHEEPGFWPVEAMDLHWLAKALPTYSDQQWQQLVVVWTKMNQLAQEVTTFLRQSRELTPPEERLEYWLKAILQVMIDRKMPNRA